VKKLIDAKIIIFFDKKIKDIIKNKKECISYCRKNKNCLSLSIVLSSMISYYVN